MRPINLLALALFACPSSPPSPAPAQPQPADASKHCRGYCDAVARCAPEYDYPDCVGDCAWMLAGVDESAVSGITPTLVECWAASRACDQAVLCDLPEEDRR